MYLYHSLKFSQMWLFYHQSGFPLVGDQTVQTILCRIIKHTLEYGDAQMEVQNGYGKVLIFDDVLATGGTVGGAVECLKKGGYEPIGAMFIAELEHLKPKIDIPYTSIIKYDGLGDTDGQE